MDNVSNPKLRLLSTVLSVIFFLLIVGCNDSNKSNSKELIDDFLGNDLPTWEEFAYSPEFGGREKLANEGVEVVDPNSPADVAEFLDSDNLTKVCTTESVSFADTPSKYVMFGSPAEIFPGALVQGKSLRDGEGIKAINVSERNTVVVSIPACSFAENFEETLPTLAGVESARGAIINRAAQQGVECKREKGSLKVEIFNSENQRSLKAGISGKYLNYSGSANGSYTKKETETTVAAIYQESLYTAVIQAPQRPSSWFSDKFTKALLDEQVSLGNISENNVPAYVAEVTYGRMMMFTMTSEATADSMKAHLNFKFENPLGGVNTKITKSERDKIEKATYTAAYIGGGAGYEWLADLDWSSYFSDSNEVTAANAVPISFIIKSTRDNVPAMVQELTEYNRTTCEDKVAGSGTFEFGAVQTVDTNFGESTAKKIVVADINGDNNEDVIWAASNVNLRGSLIIALSDGDGTFTRLEAYHPEVQSHNVGSMSVMSGDIDNDGREDIVINIRGNGASPGNFVYVFFYKEDSDGENEFVYSGTQSMGGATWETYDVRIAQFDGENGDDIAWNNALGHPTQNRSYIAHSQDTTDALFDLSSDSLFVITESLDHHQSDWTDYDYWHVEDFNGDGLADMVWQDIDDGGNRIYSANGTSTGLDFGSGVSNYVTWGGSWPQYPFVFAGDVSGDDRADLIALRADTFDDSTDVTDSYNFGYYTGYGTSNAPFVDGTLNWSGLVKDLDASSKPDALFQSMFASQGPPVKTGPTLYMADIDGNGLDDLLVTKLSGNTNIIGVGLSSSTSDTFDFTRKTQEHSDSSQGEWGAYQVFFGNIDGDDGNHRDDILWISDQDPSRIYTGRARASE